MQLINIISDRADIQFSIDELLTLNNALNEVYNGLNIIDFETKIGASRDQVKLLLSSVNKLASELRPPRYLKNDLRARVDKPDSYSKTIKKQCILETSKYQVTFFLKSLDDFKQSIGIIVAMNTNPNIEGEYVRSSATRIQIASLQSLVLYLEEHINALKENPSKISAPFYYHIFQIQALSGNVISEDEGSFNLRFMVNVGVDKDKGNTNTSASAEVTFRNIHEFTSSLQAALNEFSDLR